MRYDIRFSTKVIAGYAVLTVLLAGTTALSIRSLAAIAEGQLETLRQAENQITRVERLRWNGELIVSHGRGYLLSGDTPLLENIRHAQAQFDEGMRALKSVPLQPQTAELVAEVESAAQRFRRVQEELFSLKEASSAEGRLAQRFEQELLPLRNVFGRALDAFVERMEKDIQGRYEEATRARRQLRSRMYALLGGLVLIGIGVAGYFARILIRAFRQEHQAVEMARDAVAARNELLGVVAHDLRNPLGAIALKAGLLLRISDSEKTQKQARSIHGLAQHMEHLIASLLDLATIEAGRFSVNPRPHPAEALASEAREMFEDLSEEKQVELECVVEQRGLYVRADPERIQQVLANLVGNALKFTPAGGKVSVHVSRDSTGVRFAVRDTGPGIPEEHLGHVFERYWKRELQGKKGTGLGLFIARSIVEAHGGRIWAENGRPSGAHFHFTLPEAGETLLSAGRLGEDSAPGSQGLPPGGMR